LNGQEVELNGKSHELVVICHKNALAQVTSKINPDAKARIRIKSGSGAANKIISAQRTAPLDQKVLKDIRKFPEVKHLWSSSPVFYIKKGEELFSSAREMLEKASQNNYSLGELAWLYESDLLSIKKEEILKEMMTRYRIMKASITDGLNRKNINMKLLKSSAWEVLSAEKKQTIPIGGIHTRAAARAMAVMHVNNSMGVVCAAPTGGSAGVIPGVISSLEEEKNLPPQTIAMSLFAAAAIGLIISRRATFAAEIAGCQVEIGAAGAMAAAAVVEWAGGDVQMALDAAAISLQNTMGSICDPVQGACEIPCHTRNAVAASSAFVCADLIMGGYRNPIPLDETIDAVLSVGKMLPSELRCTALGGLAVTPSALKLGDIK
jgi:L-serine dehydratase